MSVLDTGSAVRPGRDLSAAQDSVSAGSEHLLVVAARPGLAARGTHHAILHGQMDHDMPNAANSSSEEMITPQRIGSCPRAKLVRAGPGPADAPGDPSVVAGRYQLLERIGEGGMGVVWRSYDLDLEEVMAIKFLREDLADDDARRACFRREVKLARHITHPNVARVHDFGNDHGLYYLTMEYISGESLHSLLARQSSLRPREVYRSALGLCRGLAAAHAAGIVHGDIKPSNILLSARRGAVLTDFGIARALSEVLGKEESIGGTPLYMAPEQILGGVLALQSDVYAAGVVLFESLTGELPWPDLGLEDLLAAKCGCAPDLKARAPALPDAWCRLISSCLRVDPAKRPADGRELLGHLREVGAAVSWQRTGAVDLTIRARRPLAAAGRPGEHVGDTLDRLSHPPSLHARDDAAPCDEAPAVATRHALGGRPRIHVWPAVSGAVAAR